MNLLILGLILFLGVHSTRIFADQVLLRHADVVEKDFAGGRVETVGALQRRKPQIGIHAPNYAHAIMIVQNNQRVRGRAERQRAGTEGQRQLQEELAGLEKSGAV